MKKILIVHPEGNIHNNPNLLGIVNILCESGYFVDVFSTKRDEIFQGEICKNSKHILFENKHGIPLHEGYVSILSLDELNDTTISEFLSTKIEKYDLIIGVDRGIIEASIISKIQNIPLGLISYELFFADETCYEFKQEEITACENLSFAVCQDYLRSSKLSEENKIDLSKIINIPVVNRGFDKQNKSYYLHEKLNIPKSKKIAIYTGSLSIWGGTDYLIQSTKYWDNDWVLVLHSRYYDPWLIDKVKRFASERIYLSEESIDSVDDMDILLNSADLGITFYKPTYESMYTGKNLEYIGLASGKTFTYLKSNIPVYVNEIGEMSEIINDYNIGFVFNPNEPLVINISDTDLQEMKNNIGTVYPQKFDLNKLIEPLLTKINNSIGLNGRYNSNSQQNERIIMENTNQNNLEEEVNLNEEAEKAIMNGDYENAIIFLQKIIEKTPADTNALNNLAVVLASLGETEDAKRALNLVLKVDPQNEIAIQNLEKMNS